MKRGLLLIIAMITVAAFAMTAVGIYAACSAPDDIKMENPAYKKHKKGIVTFSHTKHSKEYAEKNPDLYKNGCGECHHDKDGKPLSLKEGDEVESCIACHKNPGEPPKGKDAPKLSKKEKLGYHAYAIHKNCKDCHKAFNKANNSKAAPTTCTKCHPKNSK